MKQRKGLFYPGGLFQFHVVFSYDPVYEAPDLRPESAGSCSMSFNVATSRAITLNVGGTEKPELSSFLMLSNDQYK